MASESRHPTTVIVGAGIFGTSTAYHLSKTVPPESITIIDRHPFPWPQADRDNTPYGASHDINKIVRADYSDPFYMQLAQEAIEQWQTLDLIKDFYYRTGWVMLDEEGSDLAERIRSNFKKFGVRDETRDATFDEIRRSWGGLMKDVNTEGFGSAYWNPGAGWAEADRAVEALLCDAVTRGVRYHQGRVSDLCLDENVTNVAAGTMGNGLREIGIDAAKVGAAVSGVKLEDGTLIRGDRIVLATGAWTSSLMSNAESQLGLEGRELVECQVKAAGVVAVHFELSEQEKTEFDQLPVVVYGAYGEILPPPPNRLLKFTNAGSFTNNVPYDGRTISVPAASQREVPEALKAETLDIVRRQIPSMLDPSHRVAFWRLCWDAITPKQHQLITRHPNPCLSNLFLAVGGSFHSWKFLPIIGKYVANVVEGISNGAEKDQNWAWKVGFGCFDESKDSAQHRVKNPDKGAHEKVIPKRDLKDLVR